MTTQTDIEPQYKISLKRALLQNSNQDYEKVRQSIIALLGYDRFRDIQGDIFAEMFSIPKPPPITPLEFNKSDFDKAGTLAKTLGYEQTVYTSTSALWGLFCLPENPEYSNGPIRGGCIIKTKQFGLMFVQDTEDITGELESA